MIPKKSLNKEFLYIKNKLNKITNWEDILCKIGIYSYTIKKYKSMHQGKHVEECLINLLDGTSYDNDGVETCTYYGNCDFYLNQLPISLKSSIRASDMWSSKNTYNSNNCKIFDLSRNSNNHLYWKDTLAKILKKIGWEIPILAYTFDISLNKGVLFLTSLSEITEYKFDFEEKSDSDEFKAKMLDVFKYNKGAHFNISLKDAYYTALNNNRVIEFKMSASKVKTYVNRKLTQTKPIIQEII